METLVLAEMKEFTENWTTMIAKSGGSAVVRIDEQFNGVFLNIIWSLLSGKRFQHSDPQLTKLLEVTNKLANSAQIGSGIIGLFPALFKYAPRLTGFTEFHQNNVEYFRFYEVKLKLYLNGHVDLEIV
jgi:hypothetical protein